MTAGQKTMLSNPSMMTAAQETMLSIPSMMTTGQETMICIKQRAAVYKMWPRAGFEGFKFMHQG